MSELDGAITPAPSPASPPNEAEVSGIISELASLPPSSEVRRLALRVIRGDPAESIQPLVKALLQTDVRYWRESLVAAWTLGHLSLDAQQQDAATHVLLDVLEMQRRESLGTMIRRIVKRANLFVILPIFGLMLLTEMPIRGPDHFLRMVTGLELFSFVIAGPFSLLWDRRETNRVRSAAARALGQWRVPESVGALAGALNDGSVEVQNASTEALAATLPMLTDAHRGIMGAESMSNLGRGLRHPDAQIVYLILGALGKIGTSHAIPYVERARRNGRTTRIRDAAEEVLQILSKRQNEEKLNNQLLRPTYATDAPSDHLLRPAAGSSETDPDRLLRAIVQDHREN